MRLWDVKSKTWDKKHFRLSVGLAEFCLGHFGLGFQFYHSSNRPTIRYGHFAHLFVQLTWIEVWIAGDWGGKAETDKRWREYLRPKGGKNGN